MIQRIQSILIALASILMTVSAFYFNIWIEDNTSKECNSTLNSFSFTSNCNINQNNVYLLAIQLVFSLLAIFSLVNFKKRKKQLLIGSINSIVGSLFLIIVFLITKDIQGKYVLGFYIPAFAILLNILANKFIKKDEKLVQSLDRIR